MHYALHRPFHVLAAWLLQRAAPILVLRKKVHQFFVMICHPTPFGSACPANEWTLCLFATYLAEFLRHSSIKAYLSAVRSLHVDRGFPDSLENYHPFQTVIRGINHLQGALPSKSRLPTCSNILRVIHSALDFNFFCNVMF